MRAFLLCAALAPSTVALVLQPALHRGRLPVLAKLQRPLAETPRRSLVTCQAAAAREKRRPHRRAGCCMCDCMCVEKHAAPKHAAPYNAIR